jgi:hypothetical protein
VAGRRRTVSDRLTPSRGGRTLSPCLAALHRSDTRHITASRPLSPRRLADHAFVFLIVLVTLSWVAIRVGATLSIIPYFGPGAP